MLAIHIVVLSITKEFLFFHRCPKGYYRRFRNIFLHVWRVSSPLCFDALPCTLDQSVGEGARQTELKPKSLNIVNQITIGLDHVQDPTTSLV